MLTYLDVMKWNCLAIEAIYLILLGTWILRALICFRWSPVRRHVSIHHPPCRNVTVPQVGYLAVSRYIVRVHVEQLHKTCYYYRCTIRPIRANAPFHYYGFFFLLTPSHVDFLTRTVYWHLLILSSTFLKFLWCFTLRKKKKKIDLAYWLFSKKKKKLLSWW